MAQKINIKELANQFKALDQKDPSAWPLLPKTVLTTLAMALIVGVGYFADWQGQLEQLDVGTQAEEKLKTDYASKYRQSINLDKYKKQLVEVNQLLGTMLRQLPNLSQMETLITDINNAGTSHKLQFELFKPAQQETKNEIYAELPISIKLVGRYHDMGAFVSEIGQLSRIVTLNDITIAAVNPAGPPSDILSLEAVAKTFRYLDEAELAQAKAAAKKSKAPVAPAPAPAGTK